MNHKYIDFFTHNLPTIVLGLAAMVGLDANESSVLLQTLTTIVTGIMTLVPIAVHIYRNIETNKMAVQLGDLSPERVAKLVVKYLPQIESLLPNDLQNKIILAQNDAKTVAKDFNDFKANYKADLQNYVDEISTEVKKEITAKYDPILAELKQGKDIQVAQQLEKIIDQSKKQVEGLVKQTSDTSSKPIQDAKTVTHQGKVETDTQAAEVQEKPVG